MTNQIDQVVMAPAPTGDSGTGYSLTFELPGGTQTTDPLEWNAPLTVVQSAVDAILTDGQTIAVGGDTATSRTFIYSGKLANRALTTMNASAGDLFGQAIVGSLTQEYAGITPVTATAAAYTLTFDAVPDDGNLNISPGNEDIAFEETTAAIQAVLDVAWGPGVWIADGDTMGSGGAPFTITFIKGANGPIVSNPFSIFSNNLTAEGSLVGVSDGFVDGVAGVGGANVVFSCYPLAVAGTATGGTFAMTHTGTGSDVMDIPYNVDGATLASAISTATGETFSLTSGSGTEADPYIFTGPQMPVSVPTADWSGLTQGVIAIATTVTPGSPLDADSGLPMLGIGVFV